MIWLEFETPRGNCSLACPFCSIELLVFFGFCFISFLLVEAFVWRCDCCVTFEGKDRLKKKEIKQNKTQKIKEQKITTVWSRSARAYLAVDFCFTFEYVCMALRNVCRRVCTNFWTLSRNRTNNVDTFKGTEKIYCISCLSKKARGEIKRK